MKTLAYISRLESGQYGLVLWGGKLNGVAPRTYPSVMSASFVAMWNGRAESIYVDGRRVW